MQFGSAEFERNLGNRGVSQAAAGYCVEKLGTARAAISSEMQFQSRMPCRIRCRSNIWVLQRDIYLTR